MPVEISSHILDIFQNSADAGATLIKIKITVDQSKETLKIEIKDNGKGIPKDKLENALNPFYTTKLTRKTGLGLSLLKQSALLTGGMFEIRSLENFGTYLKTVFFTVSPNCPMMGNLKENLSAAVFSENVADIIFDYISDKGSLRFDTRLVRKKNPADTTAMWNFIRKYIEENAEMLEISSYGEKFFRNKEEKHEN